jgi:hypothetical protein
MTESETAFRLFNENYATLAAGYKVFFPDVKALAENFIQTIKS